MQSCVFVLLRDYYPVFLEHAPPAFLPGTHHQVLRWKSCPLFEIMKCLQREYKCPHDSTLFGMPPSISSLKNLYQSRLRNASIDPLFEIPSSIEPAQPLSNTFGSTLRVLIPHYFFHNNIGELMLNFKNIRNFENLDSTLVSLSTDTFFSRGTLVIS